jgi:hypothetical protein
MGSHILRKHEAELFSDKDNLKNLYRDKYFKEPLQLTLGIDTYHFCLTDKSCIRKSVTALQHFKGKADKQKEAILKLREAYPLEGGTEALTAVSEPPLKAKELQLLFNSFAMLLGTIRSYEVKMKPEEPFDYDTLCSAVRKPLGKLGLLISEENLRESTPDFFPSEPEVEEVQEATPLPEVDDDVLPLYTEKPLTKLEVFNLLSEEDKRGLLDAYRPPAPPPPVPVQTLLQDNTHQFTSAVNTKNPYGNVITNTKRPPKQVPG